MSGHTFYVVDNAFRNIEARLEKEEERRAQERPFLSAIPMVSVAMVFVALAGIGGLLFDEPSSARFSSGVAVPMLVLYAIWLVLSVMRAVERDRYLAVRLWVNQGKLCRDLIEVVRDEIGPEAGAETTQILVHFDESVRSTKPKIPWEG